MPNTHINLTNFNVTGGINFTDKLRMEVAVNYNKQYTPNYPAT